MSAPPLAIRAMARASGEHQRRPRYGSACGSFHAPRNLVGPQPLRGPHLDHQVRIDERHDAQVEGMAYLLVLPGRSAQRGARSVSSVRSVPGCGAKK